MNKLEMPQHLVDTLNETERDRLKYCYRDKPLGSRDVFELLRTIGELRHDKNNISVVLGDCQLVLRELDADEIEYALVRVGKRLGRVVNVGQLW